MRFHPSSNMLAVSIQWHFLLAVLIVETGLMRFHSKTQGWWKGFFHYSDLMAFLSAGLTKLTKFRCGGRESSPAGQATKVMTGDCSTKVKRPGLYSVWRWSRFFFFLTHFNPIWINCFRLSWLATIVEIGLRKPYAKAESGANLVMFDVHWITMMMLFMGLLQWDQNTWNTFPVSKRHNYDDKRIELITRQLTVNNQNGVQ